MKFIELHHKEDEPLEIGVRVALLLSVKELTDSLLGVVDACRILVI